MTVQSPYTEKRLASSLGYWCALLTTVGGIIYFLVILGLILTGQFTLPPSDAVQLFGGIISLLFCPFIVLVMVSLHAVTYAERKVFSLGSLTFTALFAGLVSINRFTQLGVVRLSSASDVVEGLEWFLPYGAYSVLFGLEMLMAAPVFSGGRLRLWLRWLMISYGVLGLSSAVLFLLGSQLAAIGFIAWGLILFVITGLLTVYLRKYRVHGG